VPLRRRQEEKAVEIAAIMMIAAVVLGFCQQFDPPTW
jgi:hypothetical protein